MFRIVKHMKVCAAGLLFSALLLAQGIATRAQTFNPAADSYIHDANPAVNYGTAIILNVKKGNSANFRKGYVKFDLTASGVGPITSAIVRLYATTSTAIGMNVHQVSDVWTETGLTWNNAPPEGAVITMISLPASPGYNEWDVTSYVQGQFTAGDKVISLVFYSAAVSSSTIAFNSREASANRPELIINASISPPAAPTGLTAASVSPTQIDLAWADNSTNESGFSIESRTGVNAFAEVASVGAGVTAWSDNSLAAGLSVTYRVRAWNSNGYSAYSNEATATTPSPGIISYYVDATGGNDGNTGLSPAAAWKTLTKVNTTTFYPGNRILFKAGEVWTGRLYPKGSGTLGSPVIIDLYGTGSKPLIDGNGMTGTGVVYLYNQQYWEIGNLEIVNNAATGGDRRGVRIEAENYGTANHIYLTNLNIHNIKGLVGQGRPEKRTSGIGFGIVDVATQETHFNDILVENCVITSCDNQGIITECVSGDGFDPYSAEWNSMKITNAVIRNNTVSDISKNAMIIRLLDGGVVEYNLCYNTANGITGNTIFSASCTGTVFQYNEGYGNHSPDADGSFYDADLRSPNTYWQYSYSHDNAHGLFWTCTVQADANVVCRYNISQNDQGIIFCINYPVTSVKVYNNTVYCPANLSPIIISERNNGGSGSRTYTFNNNLIYNLSPTASYDFTLGYSRTIDYNCFWGIHPATEPSDSHKVTADPKLANAGSGGIGIITVDGYKLLANSSCINTGKSIAGNGNKDYWGNQLYNGAPDIGAHEFTLPPSAPTNLAPTVTPPSQLNLNWTDNSSNEYGFRIEQKKNSGSYMQTAVVGAGVNTYSTSSISLDTSYMYRVCAFNAAGNSAWSNEAIATNRWTGSMSSDWENGSNWEANVIPDTATYVTISPTIPGPVIGSTITLRDLRVAAGAVLTVAFGGFLIMNNNLIIAGETVPGQTISSYIRTAFDHIRNPYK